MSFKFKISEKDKASARLIGSVHRALAAEIYRAGKEQGLSQKQIADKIETDKSTISRIVSGKKNITLRTIAEVCWAIGIDPRFELTNSRSHRGQNIKPGMVHLGKEPHVPSETSTSSTSYNIRLAKSDRVSEGAAL